MFGLGNRTVSFGFAIAALFFGISGPDYVHYCAASLVIALVFAYIKMFHDSVTQDKNFAIDEIHNRLDYHERIINSKPTKIKG